MALDEDFGGTLLGFSFELLVAMEKLCIAYTNAFFFFFLTSKDPDSLFS